MWAAIIYLMTKIFEHHNKLALLFACLALLGMPATSLSETGLLDTGRADTSAEKILVDADRMQMNLESGKSVYSGHVKITRGDLILTGDTVTLEQKGDEVDRFTVTGKPARYNHVTKQGDTVMAQSEHMIYIASQNKLVMTINARLEQPDHQLSSQKIIYDTLKRTVIAGGATDKQANDTPDNTASGANSENKQRVNITLTPKKSPSDQPATVE